MQLKNRLPDNVKILKKVGSIDPASILNLSSSRSLTDIAVQFRSLGNVGIDVSGVEDEWQRLRHTSLSVNDSTPLLQFWSAIAFHKSGGIPLFPHLTQLVSTLVCLPISNATVERMFSVMNIIKNKLRNSLAIPMVEAVLATRHGLKRRGETCSTMTILPGMMRRFNYRMYDHKAISQAAGNVAEEEEEQIDEEMAQVLQDVEDIFGEPIILLD